MPASAFWLEAGDAVPPFAFASLAAFVANPAERRMLLRLRTEAGITTTWLAVD
jgi:hypothetical protein